MPTPRVRALHRHAVAIAALTLLTATAARGQPAAPDPANLRGESGQTRKRLAEAEKKLIDGKTAEAVEAVQRVLDDAGDDLVALDAKQYRPARWVAHQILARLPADALKGYRDRVEVPARKLLDAGKASRDPAPLWQLLDRYFVSRPADEGLLLLGDLLFERGEFHAAEQLWRRLLPDAGADLPYPKSQADAAAVRARLVLAAAFAGDVGRAEAEFATLKEKHPDAKGNIAGRDGPYAETLRAVLDSPPVVPPAANRGADWPAFGGAPDRSARTDGPLPASWKRTPAWAAAVPPGATGEQPRHNTAPDFPPRRPPAGHPVIAGGTVFLTDGYHLFGYDLRTGTPAAPVKLANPPENAPTKLEPDACPALAAAGGRLYVRAGPPLIRPPDAMKEKPGDTEIVCLAPAKDGMAALWRLRPPAGDDGAAAVWEGAPLVAGRRMWVAYARFEGGRVVQGVACYDPADTAAAPERPAWSAEVADGTPAAAGEGRARQELLTLAGRNVVFNTNAGAVVALDAATGRRAWGFRYPRSPRADADRSPHPSPAVACGGRVFVAPTDGERVYALDAETGQLLWESAPAAGAQVLGVAAGRVIVEVAGPRSAHSIRGLNTANGSYHRGEGGWIQDNPGLPVGYGRGFVTDEVVVWATRAGLYFLQPSTGLPVPHMVRLDADVGRRPPPRFEQSEEAYRSFGNVAWADGVLVAVRPKEVRAYIPEPGAGVRPAGVSPREVFEAGAARAEAALRDGDPADARATLLALAGGDLPRPFRAWAAARVLLLTPKAEVAKPPPDLLRVLTPDLLAEWVLPPDGVPATVGGLLDRLTGREPAPPAGTLAAAAGRAEKSGGLPTLTDDAAVARTLRFDSVAVPLRWLSGMGPPSRLFVATADELVAVPLTGGEPVRRPLGDHFTHAADAADGFVVAGPLAVAVYARGPAPEWVFRVPATPPLPETPGEFRMYSDLAPPPAELSSFRLAGDWLVARLGERHLIALDLKGRRVAWVLGANGEPAFRPTAFPGAAEFGAEFLVTGRLLLVQLSTGRRWLVSLDTGRPLPAARADRPTAAAPWAAPPAELDADSVVVSDGAGLVRLLDPETGGVRWMHEAGRDASLTGEPPQTRGTDSAVLVAVRRNHGVELDRLDATDGLSSWSSGPAFLDVNRVSLAHVDADGEHVYVTAGNTLVALALKTGEAAWEAELPDARGAGGWVVRAGRECVVAYPEFAVPREPVAEMVGRAARSVRANPELWRLPALAAGLYDAWVARTVPVLLFDPETGRQLARIDVPAAGPHLTAWFDRDTAVVATGDRIAWFK